MTSNYKFSEEDVNELFGEDLSLPASLATLINNGGDIRSFLIGKLEECEEIAAAFQASQSPKWTDKDGWNQLQDRVDASEARYINQRHFGGL